MHNAAFRPPTYFPNCTRKTLIWSLILILERFKAFDNTKKCKTLKFSGSFIRCLYFVINDGTVKNSSAIIIRVVTKLSTSLYRERSPKCENPQNTNFETPVKRMKPTEFKGRVLNFDSSEEINPLEWSPGILKPAKKYDSFVKSMEPEEAALNIPEKKKAILSPTKQFIRLQKRCKRLEKLLKIKRSTISLLQKKKLSNKKNKISIQRFLQEIKFSSITSKSLVSMQINHKKRTPWTINEKKLALSIYYKSPTTYEYMRKNKIILPGASTVRRWLNSIHFTTGFSSRYMEQIQLKVSFMSYQEKQCVVLLDEISIMKSIEYNKSKDEIEGYEDLGTLGRIDKIGSHALVIMVRGLYNNWKFPLSYYFTGSGIKGDNLAIIVKESVQKLFDLGLTPVAIVCDQGTQNRRMFSLLGGTIKKPFTEICDRKLFLVYDMPHLIKSLRNNLLNGNIQIDTKIISFDDVKKTYEIDSNSSTARAMCKITPAHLAPNAFQKMSCKLAVQVLSRSVSAAIKTCVGTKELNSSTALNTASFIEDVNDMFDSANSKNLYDPNPNRRPLNDNNPQVFENLKKIRTTFQSAVKINKKNKKNSIPPCFEGFVWTITALLEIYESEKPKPYVNTGKQFFFIMTNRLTQDPLENFFSIMRQKNGYNKNPTARTFRCCFGTICTYSLMKCSEKCNCEDDNDEFLNVNVLKDIQIETNSNKDDTTKINDDIININTGTELSCPSISPTLELSPVLNLNLSLENCSILYFAGYIAKRCMEMFKCVKCEELLILTSQYLQDKNQLLLLHKTYGDSKSIEVLKNPSKLMICITKTCLDIFNKHFNEIKHEKKIVSQLMDKTKTHENNDILTKAQSCYGHYIYMMELLYTVKIFKECKWTNSDLHNKAVQHVAKLRILQHN
ncbi:hypothetical protein QTP88_018812 [Uroleucon formosanum]